MDVEFTRLWSRIKVKKIRDQEEGYNSNSGRASGTQKEVVRPCSVCVLNLAEQIYGYLDVSYTKRMSKF